MSNERLEKTQQFVEKLLQLMEEYESIPTMEPMTHSLQVLCFPPHILKPLLERLRDQWMYHEIATGEIGVSEKLAEAAQMEERVQKVYDDQQIEQIKEMMKMLKYYIGDEGENFLEDLGFDGVDLDE